MFLEFFLVGLAVVASGAFGYYIGWAMSHPKQPQPPQQPSRPTLPSEIPGNLRLICVDGGARYKSATVPVSLWQPNPQIDRWETVEDVVNVPGPPAPMVATHFEITSSIGKKEYQIREPRVVAPGDTLRLWVIDLD